MKCRCKADLFSKDYPNGISGRNPFNAFRRSADIRADYTCETPTGKKEVVSGTQRDDFFNENDNTLTAWGATVSTTRTPLLDIQKTVTARWFDPELSPVPELQDWARKNG